MMADTMYAWSRILYGAERDDEGNLLGPKAIEVGDSVSQSDIDVSDEEWQSLVDQEVVRSYPLADDLKDVALSPRQIMQNKLTDAQQGYDVTGPTADLVRRFDDEGEVLSEEEQAANRDAAYQEQIDAGKAADSESESEPTPTPPPPPPTPTTP
jgi:hypothetical protein